jgi:hypothetical protein
MEGALRADSKGKGSQWWSLPMKSTAFWKKKKNVLGVPNARRPKRKNI